MQWRCRQRSTCCIFVFVRMTTTHSNITATYVDESPFSARIRGDLTAHTSRRTADSCKLHHRALCRSIGSRPRDTPGVATYPCCLSSKQLEHRYVPSSSCSPSILLPSLISGKPRDCGLRQRSSPADQEARLGRDGSRAAGVRRCGASRGCCAGRSPQRTLPAISSCAMMAKPALLYCPHRSLERACI